MKLIQNFLTALQRRALQRQLLRQAPRPNTAVPYALMRSIGILFNASDLDNREKVLRFAKNLRQNGKNPTLLGYFDHPVKPEDFGFTLFTREDFSWNLKPKSDTLSQFVNTPFDLLIHADTQNDLYDLAILASSHAALRAGPFTGKTACYEIMIDPSGNTDLNHFLQQLEFLLQKTNVRNKVA
jgi:hypothetical protein